MLQNTLVAVLMLVSVLDLENAGAFNSCQKSSQGFVIVTPNEADCNLESIFESDDLLNDTVIYLQRGVHHLNKTSFVENFHNLTLVGNASAESVSITCEDGAGLSFMYGTKLTLSRVTIKNCSFPGDELPVAELKPSLDTEWPRMALFVGQCIDLNITDVLFTQTNGIGLVAVDTLGSITIANSSFVANLPQKCSDGETRGGVLFFFPRETAHSAQESGNVQVWKSHFVNNSNCNSQADSWYIGDDMNSLLRGGSGLSFITAQHDYKVSVKVNMCLFKGNNAQFGAGMFLGTFEMVRNFSLSVTDTMFSSNGLKEYDEASDHSFGPVGSAFTFLKDLNTPPEEDNFNLQHSGANEITIQSSTFEYNRAISGGALFIQSQYRSSHIVTSVTLTNCSFSSNKARVGSAGTIGEQKSIGLQDGLGMVFVGCSFTNNELETESIEFISTSIQSTSVLNLEAMNVSFRGETLFIKNNGTPVHAVSTVLNWEGSASFRNNIAANGGAIALIGPSVMEVNNHTRISFTNNEAYVKGGAIFAEYNVPYSSKEMTHCFLVFGSVKDICYDCHHWNISLYFTSNDATLGTALFGVTLDTCDWVKELRKSNSAYENVFQLLQQLDLLHFNPSLESSEFIVNTVAEKLKLLTDTSNITVMAGEQFSISILAIDFLNHTIPDPLSSAVIDKSINGPHKSSLGRSGYWFIDTDENEQVPVFISSKHENSVDVPVTIAIYSTESNAQFNFTVSLTPCYAGFDFNDSNANEMYHYCACSDEVDTSNHVNCFANNGSIIVDQDWWIGKENSTSEELIVSKCIFGYCKERQKSIIEQSDFDSQCAYNRSGLLCGQCRENYSAVFFDQTCQICTNSYIAILVFIIPMGIVLIYLIGPLDLTVSHGFINSILFYSNIVNIYRPLLIHESKFYLLFIFPSQLSLGLGFQFCFYNGMTTLHRTYINLLFPTYLWILMGCVALLARYNKSSKIVKPLKNFAAMFSTLLLMTYTSAMQNCAEALGLIYVDKIGYRWSLDPTLPYADVSRIPLIVLSLVMILIYLIPVPILLLFPSLTTKLWIGRKLLPLYDACWAPFREKFHFWIGVRLILRIPLFLFAYVFRPEYSLLSSSIVLILYLLVHATISPFKKATRNYFDNFLTVNLILILIGGIFLNKESPTIEDITEVYYNLVLLTLAYIGFVIIFIYHTYMHCYHRYERVRTWHKEVAVPRLLHIQHSIEACKCLKTPSEVDINGRGYEPLEEEVVIVRAIRNTEEEDDYDTDDYREPLLDHNEMQTYPKPLFTRKRTTKQKQTVVKKVTTSELLPPTAQSGQLSFVSSESMETN